MVDAIRELLRRHYLLGYDELKTRLTQRLGSAELASDALQDAWLRLDKAAPVGPVDRPHSYILRVAYNLGLRSRERARETLTLDDARTALSLVDEMPDPARIWEARAELEMLKQVMRELTPRRRDILLASRLEGIPVHEIAARYGISQRMAERELKRALTHCAERLDKKIIRRFGPGVRHVSDNEKED
jgi:RNA polymerase sigma-70 factor (ECF subfamily)